MNKTVIDEVSFYPVRPTEKGLIGFASCLYDGRLSLNSIAVYTTLDGDIRLVFPNKILPNTKEINIFYPINQQTYELIKEAVAEKLRELIEKAKNREPDGKEFL